MSTLHNSDSISLPINQALAPDWFLRKTRSAQKFIINLAPLRYAFVTDMDGPIGQIDYGETTYMGKPWQLSRAILREQHQHPMGSKLCLFHPADGSGVGTTRLEARAKAISEALERWAYYETSSGAEYATYGYQYANSTKGMAAFPGIFPKQARRMAVAEACEHFAIDAWWNGALPHWSVKREDCTTVFIHLPEFQGFIALVIRPLNLTDYVAAYGFGSGNTPAEAEMKAQLEAARLETLLTDRDQTFNRRQPIVAQEQRLLHLASAEGYSTVKDRLAAQPWRSPIKPKVIFDGLVQGAWSRYTHVWRYALEPVQVNGVPAVFA